MEDMEKITGLGHRTGREHFSFLSYWNKRPVCGL
jgi:hypothetical protein